MRLFFYHAFGSRALFRLPQYEREKRVDNYYEALNIISRAPKQPLIMGLSIKARLKNASCGVVP